MNMIIRASLVGLTVLTSAMPAQSEPAKMAAPRLEPKALLALTLSTLRVQRPLGLPPPVGIPPCSADGAKDDCSSKILLKLGSVTYLDNDGKPVNSPICVAVGYDVEVMVGAGVPKNINYSLEVKDASIKAPEFVDAHILQDLGGESGGIVVKKQRLTIKTKHATNKNAIVFLPVIKWNNNGQWDLCAAVDPKIVNV